MIKYNSKLWFRHIIRFRKSDTLRRLWWEILIVGAYTGGLAWLEHFLLEEDRMSEFKDVTVAYSIVGFVLSLLLVFRTNTAYDRWWEGRKLWGALVNNTRNLAIKINSFLPEENTEDRKWFERMIPNLVYALKEHLREGVINDEIDDENGLVARMDKNDHKLNFLTQEFYRRTKAMYKRGDISGDELIVIDKELKSFLDITGACERIRNTPIPFSYNIFLKKFIVFYVATLPIGFVAFYGYWAIPTVMFIFYVLVSLELIAEEIEDPFGTDDNDLPTEELAEKIKGNVQEIFRG